MIQRAVFVCLLVAAAPVVVAAQASHGQVVHKKTKTKTAHAAASGQLKAEDANVRQLKAKVGALESQSDASARELAERDRKIEELQRQLAAEQHR
jgi:septal ring factor EnvC (AmiA/AmiB activator)